MMSTSKFKDVKQEIKKPNKLGFSAEYLLR
jgi:hypothetical protein